MSTDKPAICDIRRTAGQGGQVAYEVVLDGIDGQRWQCALNGNMFVGPVLLFSRGADGQTFTVLVHQPRRFGEFATEDWVHRFFAEWDEADSQTEELDGRRA